MMLQAYRLCGIKPATSNAAAEASTLLQLVHPTITTKKGKRKVQEKAEGWNTWSSEGGLVCDIGITFSTAKFLSTKWPVYKCNY